MKINKLTLLLAVIGILSIAGVAYAYTYTIKVIEPINGQVLTRGTYTNINWTIQSDNVAFNGYGLDIFLEKYPGGGCVTGLPCPMTLSKSPVITREAPYRWLVGEESTGAKIPDGQYTIRIYSRDASAPVTYGGKGPGTGKPVEGVSGVFTIESLAPTVPTSSTTPTVIANSDENLAPTSIGEPPVVVGAPNSDGSVDKMRTWLIYGGGLILLGVIGFLIWLGMRKKDISSSGSSIPPSPPSVPEPPVPPAPPGV